LAQSQAAEPTRRDFLYIATGTFGAVGAVLSAWPLIDQMNPTAAVLALASIEVDISTVEPGQAITVMWRGKPIFIRHRTPKEIQEAEAVPVSQLLDPYARNANFPPDAPATDQNRLTLNVNSSATAQAKAGSPAIGVPAPAATASSGAKPQEKPEWLVVVGVCTHLGCIPLGYQGNWGGWLCPCHGSQYDTAGRVRRGPAPENLAVPVYAFLTDTRVKIG
jgi:ubiquinol-cytochrome c reductase iron-sulfur subunit